MRYAIIAFVLSFGLAATAGAAWFGHPAPPPAPPPVTPAVVTMPAPAVVTPAPTPKAADLPTVEISVRGVHAVPDGEPPPAPPVTLRSRDGRVIDPTSGRYR